MTEKYDELFERTRKSLELMVHQSSEQNLESLGRLAMAYRATVMSWRELEPHERQDLTAYFEIGMGYQTAVIKYVNLMELDDYKELMRGIKESEGRSERIKREQQSPKIR